MYEERFVFIYLFIYLFTLFYDSFEGYEETIHYTVWIRYLLIVNNIFKK
jgi:hypothetical protein